MSKGENRWFERKRVEALYTRVRPITASSDMLEAAKVALKAGASEVHLGWENCAFCGAELGEVVEHEWLNDDGSGNPKLQIHLCDRCWRLYKTDQNRN